MGFDINGTAQKAIIYGMLDLLAYKLPSLYLTLSNGWIMTGAALQHFTGSIISPIPQAQSNDTHKPGIRALSNIRETMNYAYTIFADPNINGIPIHATEESITRESDIATSAIIIQRADEGRAYVTDNVAPKPRRIEVHGYISSLSRMMDRMIKLKPTIQLQMYILDTFATSRRPVLYKSKSQNLIKCLIESISFKHDPAAENAVEVNVTLCEFVGLESFEDLVNGGDEQSKGVTVMEGVPP